MTTEEVAPPAIKGLGIQQDPGYEVLCDFRNSPDASAEVTVCVSLFNYEMYIESCLDSIAAQTLDTLSLIVVDDASTDNGADRVTKWLEAHGSRFVRACLLRHPTNLGLAAARNTAITHSQTEFVFILDADRVDRS